MAIWALNVAWALLGYVPLVVDTPPFENKQFLCQLLPYREYQQFQMLECLMSSCGTKKCSNFSHSCNGMTENVRTKGIRPPPHIPGRRTRKPQKRRSCPVRRQALRPFIKKGKACSPGFSDDPFIRGKLTSPIRRVNFRVRST